MVIVKRTAIALILAVALAPAWAQQLPNQVPSQVPNQLPSSAPNADANAGDAPDHGVARLSFIQGNVSMRHGDMGELSPTALNAPLVTTDRVVTGDAGRAEIQFDFNNMIRLAPSTEVRLSQLEYQKYQVQIAAGTTTFRVLQDNPGQVEISTPTVAVRPVKAGSYRVSVRPDGITEITVRQGQVEIYGPQGSENLGVGQTMDVRGTPDNPEFQTVAAIPLDDFDRWNLDRDRVMQQTSSYRPGYIPQDVPGGESLDPYGRWQNDPSYGYVWVPQEPQGWAPYQNGQWIDEGYYGYSWLGAEPWGWAPYHYGNWYMSPWGWAWWPGAYGGQHFWRPGLVGFFGWGPGLGIGVGFGFGFGHVGWVPLAPFEVFHPWYGAGARFGITNVNAAGVFRNARFNNAVSSVRADEFGRGAVNASNMVRPTGADMARAGAIHGAMPIAASAASRRVSNAVVNTRGMPQTSSNTRFATRASASGGVARGNTTGAGQPAWRSMNGSNATGLARGNTGAQSGYGVSRGPQAGGPTAGGAGRSAGTGSVAPRSPATESNYRRETPQSRAPAQQQQPLRMNPPIVQQRSAPAPSSAPRSSGGGGGSVSHGGGGGGGGHSGGGHR